MQLHTETYKKLLRSIFKKDYSSRIWSDSSIIDEQVLGIKYVDSTCCNKTKQVFYNFDILDERKWVIIKLKYSYLFS